MFDHFSSYVTVQAPHLWAGANLLVTRPAPTAWKHALKQVERRRRGDYVNAHVWIFTPDSFLAQMAELRQLGHSPWSWRASRRRHPTPSSFWCGCADSHGRRPTLDLDDEVLPSELGPDWVVDQYTPRQGTAAKEAGPPVTAAVSERWSHRADGRSVAWCWHLPNHSCASRDGFDGRGRVERSPLERGSSCGSHFS